MKEEYKRRREAERHLVKTLPNVNPDVIFTPTRQESLDVESIVLMNVCTQGNEFIVTMTSEWWIEAFEIGKKVKSSEVNPDSLSEISDNELVPQSQTGKSLWRAMPRETHCDRYGDLTFVAPDVVGCIIPDTPAVVCTWHVRTGTLLGRVCVSGGHSRMFVSKISDNEFVVASSNGSLYFFSHDEGRNLKESSRIWKAHPRPIWEVSYHKGVVVSASADWTARLWDLESKKRIAILYHDQAVEDVAISDDYIVTCSRYGRVELEKGEVRIFKNGDEYPLLKILRHTHYMGHLKILDNKRIMCKRFAMRNVDGERVERELVVVIDIELECVVALLKSGCRYIAAREILADGRLVAVGAEGCRGVIATFSRRVRQLLCEKDVKGVSERRMMCSLM